MAKHFDGHRTAGMQRSAYGERGGHAVRDGWMAGDERVVHDDYIDDWESDGDGADDIPVREHLGKHGKPTAQWSSRTQKQEQEHTQERLQEREPQRMSERSRKRARERSHMPTQAHSQSRSQERIPLEQKPRKKGKKASAQGYSLGKPQGYGRVIAPKKTRVSGRQRPMSDVVFAGQPTVRRKPFFKKLIVAVAIVAIVGAVLAAMNAGYKSPYTWSNLQWDGNGRPVYVVDGEVQSMLGVDVSDHCEEIDWNAVAADGMEFAFIRLGWRGYSEGAIHLDENYQTYITGAKTAGLKVGVYFFSQATTKYEASEEAQFVLSNLGVEELDLPVVFDHETVSDPDGRANNLDKATITGITERFCSTLEGAGYQTMVYGNLKDMARLDPSATKDRAVWVAQYETDHPAAQFDFSIWQYTESDHVDGISTAADIDIWFTDVLPLEKYKYLKQGNK